MNKEEAIKKLIDFKNDKLERDKLELNPRGGFKIGTKYKYYELDPAIEIILKHIDNLEKALYLISEDAENDTIGYNDFCSDCKNNNEDCHGDYCIERKVEYYLSLAEKVGDIE